MVVQDQIHYIQVRSNNWGINNNLTAEDFHQVITH
jgi:hypothetical protein